MRKDCEKDAVHAWAKARSQSGDQARGCGVSGLGPGGTETLYSRLRGRQRRERAGLREGFGGSTIHLDGMGTLTAVGIVKSVCTGVCVSKRAFMLSIYLDRRDRERDLDVHEHIGTEVGDGS